MRSREQKDALTLLIARTLVLLVVVLVVGYAGAFLADRWGVPGADRWGPVVAAVAVLVAVVSLARHRRD